jgi:CDP-paratose 2-epimerase
MRILITGVCGFVGSVLAVELAQRNLASEIIGIDNLSRRGSERNIELLREHGIRFQHGDIRHASDVDALPAFDWLVDAAANPSVLAGADGKTSSRQLMEHNLVGTLNMLERCKALGAGFILLSTSRVYSIGHLTRLPLEVEQHGFRPATTAPSTSTSLTNEATAVARGITEQFPTTAPISLYGASKLASEQLALEYGHAFGFPVWINRCGVMAGAGQFGKPDQGIFAFWIHSWREGRPLKYIGFGGTGHQVRDCLHPRDLVTLLDAQFRTPVGDQPQILNVSGGVESARSLAQLSHWCAARYPHSATRASLPVPETSSPSSHAGQSHTADRPYDLPWVVLDNTLARTVWGWQPQTSVEQILSDLAHFADHHPHWLAQSS